MSQKLVSIGLSACVLGLVLCPAAFILIGALNGFGFPVTLAAIAILPASIGSLLYRFLSTRHALRLGWSGLLCFALIGGFVVVLSGFTLFTTLERIGLTCLLFLVASALSVPVVLWRETALRARLRQIPNGPAAACLVLALGLAGAFAASYLIRPAAFIG